MGFPHITWCSVSKAVVIIIELHIMANKNSNKIVDDYSLHAHLALIRISIGDTVPIHTTDSVIAFSLYLAAYCG